MTHSLCLSALLAAGTVALYACPAAAQSDVGACVGECVGKWQQCGGRDIEGFLPCCDDDFFCYSVIGGSNYSQCRRTDSVNTGWTGPFICTPGGSDCPNPIAVDSSWSGYELDNGALAIADFDHGDYDLEDSSCAELCHEREECVAFQENEDGGTFCLLYGEDAISLANADVGNWQPNFDSVLSFVKCYRPPSLCAEDTMQDVDGSNPQLYELENQDVALVFLAEEYAVSDCATICRLHRPESGNPCVGFALRGGNECYPLFDQPFNGNKKVEVTAETTVYSITDCL